MLPGPQSSIYYVECGATTVLRTIKQCTEGIGAHVAEKQTIKRVSRVALSVCINVLTHRHIVLLLCIHVSHQWPDASLFMLQICSLSIIRRVTKRTILRGLYLSATFEFLSPVAVRIEIELLNVSWCWFC